MIYIYILCTSIIKSYTYRLMVYILYPYSIPKVGISASHGALQQDTAFLLRLSQLKFPLRNGGNCWGLPQIPWFVWVYHRRLHLTCNFWGYTMVYIPVSGELTWGKYVKNSCEACCVQQGGGMPNGTGVAPELSAPCCLSKNI